MNSLRWIGTTGCVVAGLVLVSGISACSKGSGSRAGGGDGPTVQTLADSVGGLAPSGWELAVDVRQFTAENLYELIDGRAELYISYDVVGLTFASYRNRTEPGEYIDVGIYDMGTPTNAFGIFSVERSGGEPALDIGRAGYRSDANYYVWKGRYYIRVVASQATEQLQRIGLELATNAAGLVQDGGGPVWGLTALPQTGLVPDSVRYFKVDALGLDFLNDTYTAEYEVDENKVAVFLSRRTSPQAAQDVVERYIEFTERYGRQTERATRDDAVFIVCDMDGTFDVIFQKGRLIGGVTSVEDRSVAVKAAATLWAQMDEG